MLFSQSFYTSFTTRLMVHYYKALCFFHTVRTGHLESCMQVFTSISSHPPPNQSPNVASYMKTDLRSDGKKSEFSQTQLFSTR